MSARGLDPIGLFITRMHGLLGHDTTAAYIGAPVGNKSQCLLCQYEKSPDDLKKQAVYDALARKEKAT